MTTTIASKMANVKMLAKITGVSPKFTDAQILTQINIADKDFAKTTKCIIKTITQSIVSGTQAYNVVGTGTSYRYPIAMLEVYFYDGTTDVLLTPKNSRRTISLVNGFDKFTKAGIPSHYWIEKNATSNEWQVKLWPVPDKAYTDGLIVRSIVSPSIKVSTDNSELDDDYSYNADYMASSVLAAANGELKLSTKWEDFYNKAVERVAEEIRTINDISNAQYIEDNPEFTQLNEELY